MERPKRKRKQAYLDIVKLLDPRERYDAKRIVEFAKEQGLLVIGENEPRHIPVPEEILEERFYRTFWNYQKAVGPPLHDAGSGDRRGNEDRYGCQWMLCLLDLRPEERLRYLRILKELELDQARKRLAWLTSIRDERARVLEMAGEVASLNNECASMNQPGLEALLASLGSADAVPEASAGSAAAGRARTRFGGRKRWLWAVACFGLIGLVTAGSEAITGLNPFEILFRLGPGAAKAALNPQPRTLEERYQKSWLAYVDGDNDEAEQGAYRILADEAATPKLRADCFYLLGTLDANSGHYQSALGNYFEAYDLYTSLKSHANLYKASVELAFCFASVKEIVSAEEWLDAALQHFGEDQKGKKFIADMGQYYMVKMEIAVMNQDYREALTWAKVRLGQAQQSGHTGKLASALRLVGFWYTVNGCVEQGLAFTDQAALVGDGLGDERQNKFYLINRVLLQRCLGYQVSSTNVGYIRDWARMKGDSRLEKTLDLALRIPIEEYQNDCETIAD